MGWTEHGGSQLLSRGGFPHVAEDNSVPPRESTNLHRDLGAERALCLSCTHSAWSFCPTELEREGETESRFPQQPDSSALTKRLLAVTE